MRIHLYTTWLDVCKYEQGYQIKCWTRKEMMPEVDRERRMHIDVSPSEIIDYGGDSHSVLVRRHKPAF